MAIKLNYRPELYLGEGMKEKNLDKIKKKLETRPLFSGVFLISISRNVSDQLEIYDAKQLSWKYYQKNPPYIVGIADDWQEAVTLVEKMVEDCLHVRGDCELKEYLRC